MPVESPRRSVAAMVEGEVARALGEHTRVVLAVSGGRDSMVLLEAAAAAARSRLAAVATFDHGTGAAATAGCDAAERRARALGLPVERGRADGALRGEAEWRDARWRFLRAAAARHGAVVATAHTEDDQVETVLMRALRGAGARGLAGLYAPPPAGAPPAVASPVVRPLLALARDAVAAYAAVRGVRWVEDPSNLSRRHLRNRVRLDLLPALERARPGVSGELLDVARRAAEWRAEVDEWISRSLDVRVEQGALAVAGA
ncbi:MAG TPA: tRNA lysidine(34) synthetase TilS, partial [Gemmatimonadaceae bacterium]|nr:tRNA lysidine(34) synthetase TilS [Gemmatimonadaceae bacterium]